jgi:hypothetical protein
MSREGSVNWTRAAWPGLLDRLKAREKLSPAQMHERFFAGLPRDAVLECLALLDEEAIPAGLLRPDDHLVDLLTPTTRNPLRWLFARASFEDRLGEIDYRLTQRTKARGTTGSQAKVETFADFVYAWCGERRETS